MAMSQVNMHAVNAPCWLSDHSAFEAILDTMYALVKVAADSKISFVHLPRDDYGTTAMRRWSMSLSIVYLIRQMPSEYMLGI